MQSVQANRLETFRTRAKSARHYLPTRTPPHTFPRPDNFPPHQAHLGHFRRC